MVKTSAQILGCLIGNAETRYPPPKSFHHPQDNTGARTLLEARQIRLPSLEWRVQVQNKLPAPGPYWLPDHTTTVHGGLCLFQTAPSPANHTPRKENEKAL